MKIINFTPFVPANVLIETDEGQQLEIFILLNIHSMSIIIPDESQKQLISDHIDSLAEQLKEKIYQSPVIEDNIAIPDHIKQKIDAARREGERAKYNINKAKIDFETQSMPVKES